MNDKEQTLHAERRLLASLIRAPEFFQEVDLAPADFSNWQEKQTFVAMRQLQAEQIDITRHTLARFITDHAKDKGDHVEPAVYEYLEFVMDIDSDEPRAELALFQRHKRGTRLRAAIDQMIGVEKNPELNLDEKLARCEEILLRAGQTVSTKKDVRTIFEIEQDHIKRMQEILSSPELFPIYSSTLRGIDEAIGGWFPGELTLIIAPPGVGKTLCLQQELHGFAVAHGKPSLMFSLEMNDNQLAMRSVSTATGVSVLDQKLHRFAAVDIEKANAASLLNLDVPFYIDTSTAPTVAQIRARCMSVKRRFGLGIVGIDYATLIKAADSKPARHEQVAAIIIGLKQICRDLDVPVLVLAQLNRGYADRPDKRPQLTDVRDSAQMEQEANNVLALYRPIVFESDFSEPEYGEINVLKGRDGKRGSMIPIRFDGERNRITPWDAPIPAGIKGGPEATPAAGSTSSGFGRFRKNQTAGLSGMEASAGDD